METEDSSKMSHCSWVYSRCDLSRPALCLPTKDKYTTAVRFSPVLYQLRPVKGAPKDTDPAKPWLAAKSVFALPYRLVYAVATQNAIMFYDTQQVSPFGRVSNVHYTGLTDLSWSPCGNILLASSSDGYCSIVSFAPGEIGQVYTANNEEKCDAPTKVVTTDDKKKSTKASIAASSAKNSSDVKSNAKRLQFVTLSSPKANKKINKINQTDSKPSEKMEMNLESDNLGVERMETDNDDLCLVLEETEPDPVVTKVYPAPSVTSVPVQPATDNKKRVPLTTLVSGPNFSSGASSQSSSSTPEKSKGRRVNLITLSSPKPKS